MKFYTSVTKGLKLRGRQFLGLIPMFVEVAGERLVEGRELFARFSLKAGVVSGGYNQLRDI